MSKYIDTETFLRTRNWELIAMPRGKDAGVPVPTATKAKATKPKPHSPKAASKQSPKRRAKPKAKSVSSPAKKHEPASPKSAKRQNADMTPQTSPPGKKAKRTNRQTNNLPPQTLTSMWTDDKRTGQDDSKEEQHTKQESKAMDEQHHEREGASMAVDTAVDQDNRQNKQLEPEKNESNVPNEHSNDHTDQTQQQQSLNGDSTEEKQMIEEQPATNTSSTSTAKKTFFNPGCFAELSAREAAHAPGSNKAMRDERLRDTTQENITSFFTGGAQPEENFQSIPIDRKEAHDRPVVVDKAAEEYLTQFFNIRKGNEKLEPQQQEQMQPQQQEQMPPQQQEQAQGHEQQQPAPSAGDDRNGTSRFQKMKALKQLFRWPHRFLQASWKCVCADDEINTASDPINVENENGDTMNPTTYAEFLNKCKNTMAAQKVSTCFSGIDTPAVSMTMMSIAIAEEMGLDLGEAPLFQNLWACEWFAKSRDELERVKDGPQCIYSDMNDFWTQGMSGRTQTLANEGRLADVMMKMVRSTSPHAMVASHAHCTKCGRSCEVACHESQVHVNTEGFTIMFKPF